MATLYSGGLITLAQAKTTFGGLSSGDELFFFNTDDNNNPWRIDDNDTWPVGPYIITVPVNATTFSGAPGGASLYTTGSLGTVPQGYVVESVGLLLTTAADVTGASSVNLTAFDCGGDVLIGGDLDSRTAGSKGNLTSTSGATIDVFSTVADLDINVTMSLGLGVTFSDVVTYPEATFIFWLLKLPV